ncbi:helix-turn-helix transcriptional regulator [Actinomycetes bacterium KLBMP 9797]
MAGSDTGVLAVGRAVPSLVRWGVSADADLVYRCLTSFGPQRSGAVAADLGLAMRRVRAALDELAAAGLVRSAREPLGYGPDALTWRAAPPDAAVATLRRRALRRAAAMSGDGGPALPAPPPGARRLPDRDAARRRVGELMMMERAEHLAMHPEPVFSAESLAIATPLDVAVLERRVRLRSLSRPPADGDRSSRRVSEFIRLGGAYREAPRLPHKLMIFDRKVALLAIDPLDLNHGAWEIVDPATVESLVALFVQHWSGATDPRRNGVPALVLTQREKAVVGLLAEGHTDATAARRLGLSTRSVTYTLRALMDRLGVENRFQLGLALGSLRAAAPPSLAGGQSDDQSTEESER